MSAGLGRWYHRIAIVLGTVLGTRLGIAQVSAARRPVPGAPAGVTAFVDVAVVPLQDIRRTAQPAGVMIGGRWLDRAMLDARLRELEETLGG